MKYQLLLAFTTNSTLLHEVEAEQAATFLQRVGPKIQGIFNKTRSVTLKFPEMISNAMCDFSKSVFPTNLQIKTSEREQKCYELALSPTNIVGLFT